MMPGIQSPHDHKQFSVIDVIVVFSRAKCLREIGTRVPITVGILL